MLTYLYNYFGAHYYCYIGFFLGFLGAKFLAKFLSWRGKLRKQKEFPRQIEYHFTNGYKYTLNISEEGYQTSAKLELINKTGFPTFTYMPDSKTIINWSNVTLAQEIEC